MFCQHVLSMSTCFVNMFCQHFISTCFVNMFLVFSTCFVNMLCQHVLSICFDNMFCLHVLSTCFVNMFCQHVSIFLHFEQIFHKHLRQTTTTKKLVGLREQSSQSKNKSLSLFLKLRSVEMTRLSSSIFIFRPDFSKKIIGLREERQKQILNPFI